MLLLIEECTSASVRCSRVCFAMHSELLGSCHLKRLPLNPSNGFVITVYSTTLCCTSISDLADPVPRVRRKGVSGEDSGRMIYKGIFV